MMGLDSVSLDQLHAFFLGDAGAAGWPAIVCAAIAVGCAATVLVSADAKQWTSDALVLALGAAAAFEAWIMRAYGVSTADDAVAAGLALAAVGLAGYRMSRSAVLMRRWDETRARLPF
jgi:D-serine dehydratase